MFLHLGSRFAGLVDPATIYGLSRRACWAHPRSKRTVKCASQVSNVVCTPLCSQSGPGAADPRTRWADERGVLRVGEAGGRGEGRPGAQDGHERGQQAHFCGRGGADRRESSPAEQGSVGNFLLKIWAPLSKCGHLIP